MLFRQVFEQEPEVSEIDALIGEARSVLRTPEHMPFLEAEALARSWLGEPHVDTSGISSVVTATTGAVLAARLAKRLRLSARQIAEAVVIAEREVETMGIELVLE
ncbi:MAG: hypothetical protein AUG49_25130 [Catenulispora sp. 13_1_20CM_3_70_7]|nr:MAG: hypothetical protein AUG49_25130 [Catenulispora sp. 13_1_20CM_3_70_7]